MEPLRHRAAASTISGPALAALLGIGVLAGRRRH
jgi:MYXO-CTERM domain-containing protein